MQDPKSTQKSCEKEKCPKCQGTGWIRYNPDPRELEYCYGGEDLANEYVRRCPSCNGYDGEAEETFSNIPSQYAEAYYNKFDWNIYGVDTTFIHELVESFVNDYKTWAIRGKGLYISSQTSGSGKTYLSCCVGRSVMMKYNLRFKFVTVVDYIEKVSEGYTLAKQGIPDSPADIYKKVDLLVIDDIGTQLDKPWQNQEVFKLVNERMNNGLLTIYTSNYRVEKLNVDERIKSRIIGTTIPIAMPEVSIRQQKACEAQNDFIKSILRK